MRGQESEVATTTRRNENEPVGTLHLANTMPPLEPIIWAMYAENGAANVISASHFLSSLSGQAPGAWVGSGC
jgi:hypothetical protein